MRKHGVRRRARGFGLFKYTYVKYNPVHNRNKTISLL